MKYDNSYWIDGILSANQSAIIKLNQICFPEIKTHTLNNGESEKRAEDIFDEGFSMVFTKAKQNRLNLDIIPEKAFPDFFITLCKNLLIPENAWYLKGIYEGDKTVLNQLEKVAMPPITRYVLQNSGTVDEVKDLYQSTMLEVIESQEKGKLVVKKNFIGFYIKMAQNKWNNERRKSYRKVLAIEDDNTLKYEELIEEIIYKRRQRNLYQKKLEELKPDCRNILNMYFDKVKYKEIAKRMGHANEKVIAVKKRRCLVELIKKVQNDSEYRDLM